MSVLLVPVIKDKVGKVKSSDNYTQFALDSVLFKVVKLMLLDRVNTLLNSAHCRFGFKPRHGTLKCIYLLQEFLGTFQGKKKSQVLLGASPAHVSNTVRQGIILSPILFTSIIYLIF